MVSFRLLYEASRYGHTLWITDKGKVIDLSRDTKTHYDWVKYNRDKFKYNDDDLDIYAMPAKSGWIRVQNHPVDISLTGMKNAMKKHTSIINDIIDVKLFSLTRNFWVDITFLDENGDIVNGKRHSFDMPADDNKLRKFL